MRALVLGAADPDAARRVAEDILSDPRYHPGQRPRPLAGFFERLGELLVDPLIRFLRSIGDALPSVGSPPWLALAAIVVVVAVIVAVRLASARGRQRFASGGLIGAGEHDLGADELERRADDAERRGDLDAALRLRFLAGLARLDEVGVVRFRPGLTNAAVSRALRSRQFDGLANDFDEVAYGGRPATDADVTTARSTWPVVVDTARAGAHR